MPRWGLKLGRKLEAEGDAEAMEDCYLPDCSHSSYLLDTQRTVYGTLKSQRLFLLKFF